MDSYYEKGIQWLQQHLLTCPSRKYLHIDCPGCGFQRSVLALLRGDLTGSLGLYPATIPILLLVAVTALHLRFRFAHGARAIIFLQSLSAIVILVFYIYKLLTHKLTA